MKQLLILVFVLLFNSSFAQTIEDLFLLLPDKYALNFNVTERKDLINAHKSKIEFKKEGEFSYSIPTLDIPNGYMNIEGAFMGGWEMCYWNIDNSSKLVAVTYWGCGPVCSTSYLQFYKYADGKLTEVRLESVIPKIKDINLEMFLKNGITKKDAEPLFKEQYFETYRLPRKGKNINCEYQWSEYVDIKYIREKLKGDILELRYINGKFELGSIFFKD